MQSCDWCRRMLYGISWCYYASHAGHECCGVAAIEPPPLPRQTVVGPATACPGAARMAGAGARPLGVVGPRAPHV